MIDQALDHFVIQFPLPGDVRHGTCHGFAGLHHRMQWWKQRPHLLGFGTVPRPGRHQLFVQQCPEPFGRCQLVHMAVVLQCGVQLVIDPATDRAGALGLGLGWWSMDPKRSRKIDALIAGWDDKRKKARIALKARIA